MKIAESLKEIQSKRYEKDLKNLKEIESNRGTAASQFWLRDQIIGKKKNKPEQVAPVDPFTGFTVYKPDEIKRVSLDYCVNLLSTKEPKPGYEEIYENNKRIHDHRMTKSIESDLEELPEEEQQRKLKQNQGINMTSLWKEEKD